MKIKTLILSLIICALACFTACAYGDDGSQGGDNDNNNQTEQTNYLSQFKTAIEDGKCFTLIKTVQTDYSTTQEEIYFLGGYLYTVGTVIGNTSFTVHKLYLESGLSYTYSGGVVTQGKTENFFDIKKQTLSDIFSESIVWEEVADGYSYKNGDLEYFIKKGTAANSLEYEIKLISTDAWAVYKGAITLHDGLTVDIPAQLKQYI